MTDSGRRILSQGDCDSACFLYALANASIVLTEPKVGIKGWNDRWNTAIDALPNPSAFLRACTGTDAKPWEDDFGRMTPTARKFLGAISTGPLEVELKEGVDRRHIGDFVSETSVVIVADKYHWYVIVETDGSELYVACSARLNDVGAAYKEKRTPALRHPYNNRIPLSEFSVWNRAFFVVST